jgi:streptogrisin C
LAVALLAVPANAAADSAAGSAAAAPAAAGAYDQGSSGLQTVADAYLANYKGLTPQAAQAAAVAQATGGVALKAAVEKQWKSYAGGSFDPYTARYNLRVTDAAVGRALAATGAAHGIAVDTSLVSRSWDELTAQVAALQKGSSALSRAAGQNFGIDVATNRVVAAVPANRVASLAPQAPAGVTVKAAESTKVEADACTSRANCDDFLAAGLVIRNGNPGAQVCSLGFTARNASGQRITLTAGHCSTGVGQTWANGNTTIRTIGTVSSRADSGPVDVTRIQSTNSFYGNVNSGRIYTSPPANWSPVTGKNFFVIGDIACIAANITNPTRNGNPCGTVTSLSDPDRRSMVRIDGYDACPGDSGGGWYWLPGNGQRWAAALHSRSEEGCNVNPARSFASDLRLFHSDLVYEVG